MALLKMVRLTQSLDGYIFLVVSEKAVCWLIVNNVNWPIMSVALQKHT